MDQIKKEKLMCPATEHQVARLLFHSLRNTNQQTACIIHLHTKSEQPQKQNFQVHDIAFPPLTSDHPLSISYAFQLKSSIVQHEKELMKKLKTLNPLCNSIHAQTINMHNIYFKMLTAPLPRQNITREHITHLTHLENIEVGYIDIVTMQQAESTWRTSSLPNKT
jgi:hypothetical protein